MCSSDLQLFGVAGLGGTVGLLYTGSGFGALIGPPVAGRIIDATGTYWVAEVIAGVLAFGAYLLLVASLRRARIDSPEATAA